MSRKVSYDGNLMGYMKDDIHGITDSRSPIYTCTLVLDHTLLID